MVPLFPHCSETFPSGLVREEPCVPCRAVLSFKCPGGMCIGEMSSEIVECCGVAKNKVMICADRSCQKSHAETFERRYYLSGVKVD